MELHDQHRTGLFQEHSDVAPAPIECRLTIGAREALLSAGAQVSAFSARGDEGVYQVLLGKVVPPGLVALHLIGDWALGVRTEHEPPYVGEIDAGSCWEQIDLTPCPKCGAPLVWYEAGYVPGYRVCAGEKHHHFQAWP